MALSVEVAVCLSLTVSLSVTVGEDDAVCIYFQLICMTQIYVFIKLMVFCIV